MSAAEAGPTKGPWKTDPECGNESVIDAGGFLIADCAIFGPKADPARNRANARLIAAAPDLLAALYELLAAEEGWSSTTPDGIEAYAASEKRFEDAKAAARAAISRATDGGGA